MELVTNWLWQSAVIVAVTSTILFCARRLGARSRHAIWGATFLGVTSLPLLQTAVPLLPASPFAGAPSGVLPLVAIPQDERGDRLLLSLALVWMAVHAWGLLRASLWLRRAKRRAVAIPESLQRQLIAWSRARRSGRPVSLAVSQDVHAAAALGFGAPLIAISPRLIEQLAMEELDRVVMHEWAHLQRRDDYASIAQRIVVMLAGWHPALWWSGRQLAREREVVCDETAIAATGTAKAYASTLVQVAALTCAKAEAAPALGVITQSALHARVRRVLSAPRHLRRGVSLALTGTAIVFVGALTLTSAALIIVEAAVPDALPRIWRDDVKPLQSLATLSYRVAADDVGSAVEVKPVDSAKEEARTPRQDIEQADAVALPTPLATLPSELLRGATPVDTTPPDAGPLASRTTVPAAAGDPHTPADATATAATAPADVVPARPDAAQPDRRGWSSAGDAGQTIGSGAQSAGLATGRFFSRFAGRVANSFSTAGR
jgi:beta-lactamase regulating signal transducer with metallopeptidase domain